jgi:DNA-binding response OmpR family regulator
MNKPKNDLPALLIVDDEPALRLLMTEFFKERFHTITLKDGLECISYIQNNVLPSVAIVDLEMPGMGGMEVIKKVRLKPEWNTLVIIVVSSRESSKDRISCLRAGADDYVVKPFNPEELDARIATIMRRIKQNS